MSWRRPCIMPCLPAGRRMQYVRDRGAGPRLSVSLNDELVSGLMADDSRSLAGHIGLQAHHPGSRVQIQNIRMHEF